MSESEQIRSEALKYFRYDKENGKLYWKYHHHPQTRSRFLDKEAGDINYAKDKKKYYRIVRLLGRLHRVHCLIYLIENGVYNTKMHVDHIDGNTLNNRIENLRLVTPRKNSQNREIHRSGKKLVGTSFRKDCVLLS